MQRLNQTCIQDASDIKNHTPMHQTCSKDHIIGDSLCIRFEEAEESGLGVEDFEEDKDDEEMCTKAKVQWFSTILAEAQAVTVQAEREAAALLPKCKRHYTGNAPRTICHYNLNRRKLAAAGQQSIGQFFKKAANEAAITMEKL
ncbi:hypothetical protein H0H92_008308 [Tricholoma furcatifolium]|nr:hypothetical protein H0H92_004997 [Tricholoma furcatifolium]KAG6824000.1 hypothetical protein H0H92_008308 [Tricholoma furcatifolium]